jgi:DNA gyrase subunit B
MDVEKRRLKQVTIADVKQMALILNKLMGASVAPRKEFIENNAYKANIDI